MRLLIGLWGFDLSESWNYYVSYSALPWRIHGARAPAKAAANTKSTGEIFADPKVDALADAAEKGDVKEVDRLVVAGADVNAKSKDGKVTPLFLAVKGQYYEASAGPRANKAGIRRLLEHGADPSFCVTFQRLTSTDARASLGGQASWSVIHLAAESKDDPEWLELLLKHGANPKLVYPGLGDLDTVDTLRWLDAAIRCH